MLGAHNELDYSSVVGDSLVEAREFHKMTMSYEKMYVYEA